MSENIVSTPTRERCVTSYAARTQYKPGEIHPPHIKVKDAIDIHCHAITLSTVGSYRRFVEGNNAAGWVGPIPWEKALKLGHYNLDEKGELKPEICEIVRICADKGAALFFGHATHKEIYKIAEEVDK